MKFKAMNNKGVALITTLFFLVIVTALAAGAILIATVQVRVSGSIARWEGALAAAEAGVDYIVPAVMNARYSQTVPALYTAITNTNFVSEITAPAYLNAPLPANLLTNSDAVLAGSNGIGGFNVTVNVRSIGTTYVAGGSIEPAWAYHGGAASNSLVNGYEIFSNAGSADNSVNAQVTQVIWLKSVM